MIISHFTIRAARHAPLIIMLGLALALGACSSSAPSLTSQASFTGSTTAASGGPPSSTVTPTTRESTEEVAKLFDKYTVPDGDGGAVDYRLAPMDVVDVSVYDAANLSRTAQVGASGFITLPLIGEVKASGRTTDQLQRDIVLRLKKDFMQAPEVFVTVKEYNSQRITVDGAVKNPGVFPLKGETTLVEVIASAGGLNEMGSPSGVYVLRKVDGKKMAARFDINEIRKGQKEDPKMRAGDIVMVDESGGKKMLKGLQQAMGFTGLFSLLAL